ncbi:phage tail protein [Pseudomonas sp. D3]|uniref:phage tail protein n=1 Tax=Pseudomonas sp. D3 TaxID=517398 RepID=UPI0023E44BA9|nr:phage tail protein [Pseudomonas sp. D3]WET12293.1 phage tail protein [Pseudomonas sp. D3]
MTDQNTQFFAILTAVGEAKQANASALGTSWTFAQMAVGDANGTDPIPSRTQTKLINERRRAPLNQVKVDPSNASVIIAEQIIPESVGGWWVRELALYDADGDMVAVANCAPTYKSLLAQGSGRTQVIRINLIVSSTANIELKIDPSVVLATREYVDTSVMEAIAKLDFKHSVLVATTANIVLNGIQAIDGEMLTAGARVLVKDQAQAKDNGIYVVPASGAWKRAQDADTSVEVTPGLFVSVEKGTLNSDSVWQLVTDAPIVLGTTALAFEMVAGRTGVNTGTYRSITVDKYGRVIAGTNPTSLANYGIEVPTQAEAEAESDQDNTKPMTVLRVWQAITKRVIQATTAIAGIAKIAGTAMASEGTDDSCIMTPLKTAVAAPSVRGARSKLRVLTTGFDQYVTVTADQLVLQSASGVHSRLRNATFQVSTAVQGVGGLDAGVIAANKWYSVWAIYSPEDGTLRGMLSESATAPTVPNVTYRYCRVCWIFTDATNKWPLGCTYSGNKATWKVAAGSNVPTARIMASGVNGHPNTTTWVPIPWANFAPPSAISLYVGIHVSNSGLGAVAAPNSSYGGYASTTNPPPLSLTVTANAAAQNMNSSGVIHLETSNISFACNDSTGVLAAYGYEDNL